MTVCAYTAVCEEDAVRWGGQYLAEAERLALPFAVHLDRCSRGARRRFARHRLCVGATEQNDPDVEFDETAKQGAFGLALAAADWAMAWDVDETYERDAPDKLRELDARRDADYLVTPWKNLWEHPGQLRTDGPLAGGYRAKFYRSARTYGDRGHAFDWRHYHPVVNGPRGYSPRGREPVKGAADVVCLHWGLMTRELRLQHKERWDRIYGAAVGRNPYGMWSYVLDEAAHPPRVEPNPYL